MSYTCKECNKNRPAKEEDTEIYRFTHTCDERGFHNLDTKACSDFEEAILHTSPVNRLGKKEQRKKRNSRAWIWFVLTACLLILLNFTTLTNVADSTAKYLVDFWRQSLLASFAIILVSLVAIIILLCAYVGFRDCP